MNDIILCQRGHFFDKINSLGNSYCGTCHKMAVANYEKTPKAKLKHKEWAKSSKRLSYNQEYYKNNKDQYKDFSLRKRYNITLEQYRDLVEQQKGRCLICGVLGTETKKGLVVDHNHDTGKVRGLLCNTCNSHIVHVVEKYPHLIDEAKSYLGGF